ncbi:hypothetical protein [Rubinisphaera margarita]|uniref:hypothetical protein n=1 Tax=Rubinisphaera margarita TaxID=2909586 RepID=UPI001EE952E1|nr:hypothetical protein [Rubinisphaera margarita]MCG6157285.1 hypothetical protein [Rubinisphaera margarita]
MKTELAEHLDRLQSTAETLAQQLQSQAETLRQDRLDGCNELQSAITSFLTQEQTVRTSLMDGFQSAGLPTDAVSSANWLELRPFADTLNTLRSARSRLAEVRVEFEDYQDRGDDAESLDQELSRLETELTEPSLPLSDEIVQFAAGTHPLFDRIELLKSQPASDSTVVESQPELPAEEMPAIRDRYSDAENAFKALFDFGEAPLVPRASEPESVVVENETTASIEPAAVSEESSALIDDEESDFIFDDIDSGGKEKKILTAHDLENGFAQLEQSSETATEADEEETDAAQENDVEDSLIFGDFDDRVPHTRDKSDDVIRGALSASVQEELRYSSEPAEPAPPPPLLELESMELDFSQVTEHAERAAAAQNRFDRVSYLSRLTWELITLGEYAWAYQVSNCLYGNVDKDLSIPAPPPWLIAILVMGDRVRLSSGRIAREFDFLTDAHRKEAQELVRNASSPEAFLLRAALIRGAVTTGSRAATDLLRSFTIESSQTHFYNYCSRVASFASRSNGLRLDQYFYRPGAASIESNARAIRAQVVAWKPRAFEEILPYHISTPLFSRAFWSVHAPTTVRQPKAIDEWRARQILQAHISRLLKSIIENKLHQSGVVESEIRRLSHSVLLIDGNTRVVLSEQETLTVDGRELYNHVQEAIEFASHWLVLAASYPGIESVLVPQEVNELRDEIERRQNSVFMEMQQLDKMHGHHAHRSALTACRRSMDRISQLFHPTEEPRIAEQDPQCLLNGVLLKIPGITLEEDWRCKLTPSTLEQQILLVLQQGQVTWEDAFEQQIEAGSYRSARMLLKLDAWTPEKKQRMIDQLEERRRDNAESLRSLAQQLKKKIAETRKLDVITTLEAGRLTRQVETLEEKIPNEYQLDHLRSDLNQLWQLMENRRGLELRKMRDKMSQLERKELGLVETEDDPDSTRREGPAKDGDDDQADWALDV